MQQQSLSTVRLRISPQTMLAKISTYLAGGGKALIVTTAYNKTADTPNFDGVLAAYDIQCDKRTGYGF